LARKAKLPPRRYFDKHCAKQSNKADRPYHPQKTPARRETIPTQLLTRAAPLNHATGRREVAIATHGEVEISGATMPHGRP
jgi:hypothetical protein